MAKWGFPDMSAEVERLRVELEQARAHIKQEAEFLATVMAAKHQAEVAAARLQAERDDLAARLQSIQQAERKYTAAKLDEAAKMRKGQAI